MLNFNFGSFYSTQRYTMEPTSKLLIPDIFCTKRSMKFISTAFPAEKNYPLGDFFKPFLIKIMSFTFPVK